MVLQAVIPRLAPKPSRKAPSATLPFIVTGLLTARTGIGASARHCFRTLTDLGLPTRAINISGIFNSHHSQEDMPQDARAPEKGGGTLILHLNAPYTSYVFLRLGTAQIRNRYLIGYWHWELPRLPKIWRYAEPFLHEIWVPTRFIADAVRADLSLPVRVVPHPILPTVPLAGAREQLGLAEDCFVVFNMANLSSGFERKNPLGVIAAFRRAFGGDPSACLLLKLGDIDSVPGARARLTKAIEGATNIKLIEGRVAPDEVHAFYSASDVVLSLHRSEGFGLLAAEAMARGRAVIATGWSGNMDFMDENSTALVPYKLVPVDDPQKLYDPLDGPWAEPDIDAAVEWLRKLRADPALRQHLAKAGLEMVKERLSVENYRRAVEELMAG